MTTTMGELARALDAQLWGDAARPVRGAAEPGAAGPDQIALAMDPRYAASLRPGAIALIGEGMDPEALGLAAAIVAPRGRLAMARLTRTFDPGPQIAPGIHPAAVIEPGAGIGPGAAIGPFAVIGAGARIGPGARIAAHVTIAAGAQVGADVLIHTGVRIGPRVRIGDRVILQPNAVIGADGFSFVTEAPSAAEEARAALGQRSGAGVAAHWHRIHSLGGVEIGDDVEIGAGSTIDAGTIRPTAIGTGTKIDNLVHVGHNVTVGRDALLCGQVGIAGSARIGDRVILGGQCGVSDNIFVGDDVVAGGSTKIYTNVPAGRVILGAPAVRMETELEIRKALRRLPRLFDRVRRLEGAAPGEGGNDRKDDEP